MTSDVESPGAPRPEALAGTRVIEWSAGRAGAYAGKLLRGLGAEVTLLEEAGTRERILDPGPVAGRDEQLAARARFLHGGKRSVLFEPGRAEDRERARRLLAEADVLIVDQHLPDADAAGLAPERLADEFPTLVVACISAGGLAGAARAWRYSDICAMAAGGIAFGTPSRVPDTETYPPLKLGGYQADYTCGLHAAIGAMLGLQLRRRTGKGQVIDVSAQAVVASYVRMDIAYRTYNGTDALNISGLTRQSPTGRPSTLWGLVPCSDGYFAFQASEQYQWEGLLHVLGDPEWARDERFADPIGRFAHWDDIEPFILEWAKGRRKSEVFHAAQARRVPVFPCLTVAELLEDAQQQARAFFVELPAGAAGPIRVPGAIVQLERTPWQPSFDLAAPGTHTAEMGERVEARP